MEIFISDGKYTIILNGNKFFDTNNPAMFRDALPYYLDAYKYNSENPELNYRIGVCQLSGHDRESALKLRT